MSGGLHIAPGLTLPIDMVTEPIGILANRGRGKSYTTHALVEEIHAAGVPVVVLDVKGDWWGLRSSADGKADGLPFYIFGGDHSDVPLEPTAGHILADLVVDERVSVVLDLSVMSKTKARTFTTAFAEQLYHRNREPLFVVVDEADVLIPQRASAETARLLGAMEDIAKRGRGRGIGMAVVTQRPQEVAKSVLDLMDTLILLGMTGPRSLKSIQEWISVHVDEETSAADVMATLPALPVGQAWIWSPMQHILERVKVRRIRTFDSHVTPKAGQTRTTPQGRADLDLTALGERITATIEQAKAKDPTVLAARIRELENQLEKAGNAPVPAPVVEYVEIPVLDPGLAKELDELLNPVRMKLAEIGGALSVLSDSMRSPVAPGRTTTAPAKSVKDTARAVLEQPPVRPPAPAVPRQAPGEAPAVSPARLKLLEALISLESIGVDVAPRNQVALFAGVSPKSSGYGNNLGAMNTAGLIRYPSRGRVQITDEGRAYVPEVPELATTAELHTQVRSVISEARWRILEPLIAAYPDSVRREELAERAGVSASSSGYGNNLGALRSLGLLDYPDRGWVIAADVLFLEGHR